MYSDVIGTQEVFDALVNINEQSARDFLNELSFDSVRGIADSQFIKNEDILDVEPGSDAETDYFVDCIMEEIVKYH